MNNQRNSPISSHYHSPRSERFRNERFFSPYRSPDNSNFQPSPRFQDRSPRFKDHSPRFQNDSPRFQNDSPRFQSSGPQFSTPYHSFHHSPQFNMSGSSSERWSTRANLSFNSNSSNSAYFSDQSFSSPYSSPMRYRRGQKKRSFGSFNSGDSNSGHSPDIRHYVDHSMLEDPWKELMEKEKKNALNEDDGETKILANP